MRIITHHVTELLTVTALWSLVTVTSLLASVWTLTLAEAVRAEMAGLENADIHGGHSRRSCDIRPSSGTLWPVQSAFDAREGDFFS